MRKTKLMRTIEEREGRPLEEILPEYYDGSLVRLAVRLGVDYGTAHTWIKRFGYQLHSRHTIERAS